MSKLKEGREYVFRVAAHNADGWGEFAEMGQPIRTLVSAEKPSVSQGLPPDLSISKGEPPVSIRATSITDPWLGGSELKLEVVVSGSPKPTVRWTKDNVELEESRRVSFAVTADGRASLILKAVEAKDAGKYVAVVENEVHSPQA